ncbi:fibronectin type III domain-containing protein [Actinotalea caeni]|uniref:fibronectin type III domain-containing protein n=1 Tax=Actinotalea caeni TaxID=1348467 RepID=UPI00195C8A11|nr:fibronectin type III domain-containing protein [Actinotalea caeni]
MENVMSTREEVRRFLVRLGARTTATLVAAVLVTGGATSALADDPEDGSEGSEVGTADLGLTCTVLDGAVQASWDAVAEAEDYTVVVTPSGADPVVTEGVVETAYLADGLEPGREHVIEVAPRTSEGVGDGDACTVVADASPLAPLAPAATPGTGSVTVTWGAAPAGGRSAATHHELETTTDGVSWTSAAGALGAAATSHTVTGLTAGVPFGFRVRAANAVGPGTWSEVVWATPLGVPAAPAVVSVTAGAAAMTLTWTHPTSDGGAPLTRYLVEVSDDAGATWVTGAELAPGATSATIASLVNGVVHRARVVAENAVGRSAPSSVVEVTPRTVASAPQRVTVTPGKAAVTVSWSAPVDDGGAAVTAYVVQYSTNGTTWKTASSTVKPSATSHTISGLAAGTRYHVRVRAVNAAGTSPVSGTASATTWATPSAPRSVKLTPGKAAITVRWTAPSSSGGTDRTAYVVQYSTNGTTWKTASSTVKPSATSYTISKLTNGTRYYVRVIAVNAVGKSPASAKVSTKPRTVPSAPRSVRLTPGKAAITVRWAAPSSSGGASRTAYVVQYSTNGTTWKTASSSIKPTATSYTIRKLKNGTRYYVRVIAVNAAGKSPASAKVSTKPRTVPSKPAVSGTAAAGKVTIRWTAPSSNGAAITGYVVQRYSGGTWRTVATVGASARSRTITGLANGTSYRFRVAATNAVGRSAWSSTLTLTPRKPASSSSCHPAYSGACVPIASDVDCAGGSGNGPAYVRGPVYVKKRGVDPYGLDGNGDGVGCER